MDKWGLVFVGGGGKGAYEIGAWKAINEFGINIQAVSGASVGALNSVLFASGSFSLAEAIWREQVSHNVILSPKSKEEITSIVKRKMRVQNNKEKIASVFDFSYPEKIMVKMITEIICRYFNEGFFSRSGLIKIIEENEICKEIKTANIPCYASCFNVSKMKEEYFLINEHDEKSVMEILLASSAIPIIFPPETIKGRDEYVDGGVPIIGDNAPIAPLYERENCNRILVINLDSNIILPSTVLIAAALKAKSQLPILATSTVLKGSAISLVSPVAMTGFIIPPVAVPVVAPLVLKRANKEIQKMKTYKGVKIYRQYPSKTLGGFYGTLNFKQKSIEEKINLGYTDTRKYLDKVFAKDIK